MRVIRLVGATFMALFAALLLAGAVSRAAGTRVPTGVSGNAGNAQITLSWTAPALPPDPATSTDGYSLDLYTVQVLDAVTSNVLGTVNCTPTQSSSQSCVITTYSKADKSTGTLTNGTSYSFRVRAEWTDLNDDGVSSNYSDPSSSLIPFTKPAAPTGVQGTASASDPTRATVTFTAPADNGSSITNYTVTTYDSTGSTTIVAAFLCQDSATGTTTSRTICGLSPNTAYTFKVTATNLGGTSVASDLSASTVTIPGAPNLGTATIDGTGDTADVTVTWTANSNNGPQAVTEYEVMPVANGANATSLKATWSSGSLTKTVTGLTITQSYTFKVRARNATGWGPYSSESTAVVATKKPNQPAAPTGTDKGTGSSAEVSWTLLGTSDANGSDITKYTVRAYNLAGTQQATCESSQSSPSKCLVSGLAPGDYQFTVEATNARGTSVKSNKSTTLTVAQVASRTASQQITRGSGTVNNGNNGRVDAGDTISYTFTITNNGNVALNNLTVVDSKIQDDAVDIVCKQGSPKNVIATLASNTSADCAATYTVTQTDIDAGVVNGTATVSSTAGDQGSNPSDATSASTKTLTVDPVMTLDKKGTVDKTKVAPTDRADAGDIISYSYEVTNTGNVTLSNLTVTDSAVTSPGTNIVCRQGSPKNVIASLAPAQSATCTTTFIDYTITQTDLNTGSRVAPSSGSVSGTAAQGTLAGQTNGDTTTLDQVPVVTLNKLGTVNLGGNARADAGDTISYSYVVTNTGNVTLTDLTVTDDDPLVTSQINDIQCRQTGAKNVVATLAPGASATCNTTVITYTLTQANLDAGSRTAPGTASVSGASIATKTDGEISEFAAVPAATIVKVGTVNLGVNSRADSGDSVTFEYTVTNTGNVTLTNLTVTDENITNAPVNITCPGASAPNLNKIASLAPAAAAVKCTATYSITQANLDSGSVVGTAELAGTASRGTLSKATSLATTTLTPAPSATLSKNSTIELGSNSRADAGDLVSYEFVVTNTGNVTLSNLTATDTAVTQLQAATSIVCQGRENISPKNFITTLAVNGSVTCTAVFKDMISQADLDSGALSSTFATVSGTAARGTLSDVSDDVSTTLTAVPLVTIAKTGSVNPAIEGSVSNQVDAGDKITYTYVIANTGNVKLTELTVTDTGVTPIHCRADDPRNKIINLLPGQSATCTTTYSYTILQADLDAGSYVGSIATVGGSAIRGDLLNASDGDTTSLTPAPAVTIDKIGVVSVGTNSRVDANETVSYTFVVANTGNVKLTNVTVTDPLIADAAINCNNSSTNAVAELNAGASATCTTTYTYTITQANLNAGTLTNPSTASVSATPVRGTGPVTNTAADDTALPPVASMSLEKKSTVVVGTNGQPDVGEKVSYSFEVTNTGNVTLTDISVTDAVVNATTIICRELLSPPNVIATLAPGATVPCTTTYQDTITVSHLDAGSVTSSLATASGTAPRGTLNTPTDSVSTVLDAYPAMTLEKTDSVGEGENNRPDAGEKITYAFVVTNTGNVTLTSAYVTDAVITSINCPGATSPSNKIEDLEPGDSTTCTTGTQHTITQAELDSGTVTSSTATLTATPSRSTVTDVEDSATTNLDAEPSVTIEKKGTASKGTNGHVDAGEKVTYIFTVTNTGNVTLTSLSVSDATISTITCPSGSNSIVTLEPGGSTNCTSTYEDTVTQDDIDAGEIAASTATVTATAARGGSVTDTDNSPTALGQEAALSVAKSYTLDKTKTKPDDRVDVGDTITYTYVVSNDGNVTITDLFVGDDSSDIDDTDIECPESGDNTIDELAPGETKTCSIVLEVDQAMIDAGEDIVSSGSVSGSAPGPMATPSDSDSTTVTLGQLADVSITTTSTTNFGVRADVDDTITYSFLVKNEGNVTLTDLTVSDNSAEDGAAIECPTTLDETIPELLPGQTKTCSITVHVTQDMLDDESGSITNEGTVTGNTPDGDTVTDSDEDSILVTATPSAAVTLLGVVDQTKAAPTYRVDAGDKITYTFTVTNTGNVSLTDVSVVDSKIPNDTTAIKCEGTEDAEDNIFNILYYIAPGESATCVGTYTITTTDINTGSVTNLATVNGVAARGTLSTATKSSTNTFPYLLTSAAGTRVAITKPALTIAQDAAVAKLGTKITVGLKTPTTTSATAKVTKYVITFKATGAPVQTKTLTVTANKVFTTFITGVKGKSYQITVVATFGNKKTATWTGPKVTAG